MKFRNKETGSILEPQTKSVEEMMKKSNRYEVYVENKKNDVEELTVKELKDKLKKLGIEFSNSDNKAKLQELLEASKNKKEDNVENSQNTNEKEENGEGENGEI